MKLIIAGTRTLNFGAGGIGTFLKEKQITGVTEIISGGAAGVDSNGQDYAVFNNIKFKIFKPDWETYGRAAGPVRNRQMAEYADALLLIWDGKSRGSLSMKQEMQALGKPIYEVVLPYGPKNS
jgi:hypothetical protein